MKIFVLFLCGMLSASTIAHTGHGLESGMVHNAVHLFWLALACGFLQLVRWYVCERRTIKVELKY